MKLSSLLGLIAFAVLFLKLPGISELFDLPACKSCHTNTPYLPMLAAAYMAAFLTCILSFPSLPSPALKRAGIVWSLGLACGLTYLSDQWCVICLIGHTCHVGMWTFWRPTQYGPEGLAGMKLSMMFTSATATAALYSTLHFTFLVYGLSNPMESLVRAGAAINSFHVETVDKQPLSSDKFSDYDGVILNFVSDSCPYCREQILLLDKIAGEFDSKNLRFVNVSRQVISELQDLGPRLEWVEDSQEDLFMLFGVNGYPSLVLIDSKGVVVGAKEGVHGDFEEKLKSQLDFLCARGCRQISNGFL
ncbi:MAG: TlpA disulfide reductase family protein [Waddliaceae bacterium]